MNLRVKGKNLGTIVLNKNVVTIRGTEETMIVTDDLSKIEEIFVLRREGVIDVVYDDGKTVKGGKTAKVRKCDCDSDNDDCCPNVVSVSGEKKKARGRPKGAKNRAVKAVKRVDVSRNEQEDDPNDPSIIAMKQLEGEELEKDNRPVEKDLPINDQMGRPAVFCAGTEVKTKNMVPSAIPEAEQIKNLDPFIDKKDKGEDGNTPDPFIEI